MVQEVRVARVVRVVQVVQVVRGDQVVQLVRVARKVRGVKVVRRVQVIQDVNEVENPKKDPNKRFWTNKTWIFSLLEMEDTPTPLTENQSTKKKLSAIGGFPTP